MLAGEALKDWEKGLRKAGGLGKHRCLTFCPHGILLSDKHLTTKSKCFTSAMPCSFLVLSAFREFSATVLTSRLECSFVQSPLSMEMVPSRAGWDPDKCPYCRGLWGLARTVKWVFPVWCNWVDMESQLQDWFWKWLRASRLVFLLVLQTLCQLQSVLQTPELTLAQK